MTRWERVQALFEETAALPEGERATALRTRAEGDEALVRDVEALLRADSAPLEAFERGAGEVLDALRAGPAPEELCGTSFDGYRIEEHLASGGMAAVYRATRTSAGTERRVAVKVVRHGLDGDAFLARFRKERETLARLEHEHVVAFLDAGTLPDGRPYLAMELVEGEPLTAWGARRPLRARLATFLAVLDAVRYAHQQLVVHGDLKPSNVLVNAQGAPRLLDFGVATVLGADAPDEGGAPLTPGYASPEQLRGAPLSTASDVYSLGVLLRELAGATASGETPAPPPGDLAAIVARATAEEPGARYASVDRLADDVRRFLAHEPVAARPASLPRRAALLVRRHAWPVALAAGVLVALVAGWIASDLARRSAEREAGAGWGAHAQAKVAARIFEGWIADAASADPALAAAAVAHLERALVEYDGLHETEVMVRLALAELYLGRGEPERAGPHARRALVLARTTRGVGAVERERAEDLARRASAGR